MHEIQGKQVQFRLSGLYVSADVGGHLVGRVKYHEKRDGTVLLSDIVVEERVILRDGLLPRMIRRIFPEWGLVFPRKQGIGSELLRRFLDACERRGVPEVFGNVTPEADRDQPFLRGWYEKYGFEVRPPDGRDEWFPVRYKVVWTAHASQVRASKNGSEGC